MEKRNFIYVELKEELRVQIEQYVYEKKIKGVATSKKDVVNTALEEFFKNHAPTA